VIATLAGALAVVLAATVAQAAPSIVYKRYRSCATLNAVWPHGVGRYGARDHTSGVPVTNFKRNNRLYELNKGRDRDGDKIACEKQ
jgi:hypothetical protein